MTKCNFFFLLLQMAASRLLLLNPRPHFISHQIPRIVTLYRASLNHRTTVRGWETSDWGKKQLSGTRRHCAWYCDTSQQSDSELNMHVRVTTSPTSFFRERERKGKNSKKTRRAPLSPSTSATFRIVFSLLFSFFIFPSFLA